MGAFGDWAQNYYDSGLSVLPVHPEKKSCFIKGWTEKFSHNFPSEKDQELYIKKYDDHDIGLACGKSSGIIAVDFDYEGMADAETIERLIIGALPITPCIKKGSKGWTRFYRFDGEVQNIGIDRFGIRMVDILSTGRLTVLPPSLHKHGMQYTWIGSQELLDCDDSELPYLYNNHVSQLSEISQYDNSIFKEIVEKKARHDAIVGFILRYSDQAKDLDDLIQETLQADIELHKDEPKGPYLSDKRYLKDKTSYEYTKHLCERIIDWKKRKRASSGLDWDIGKYPRLHSEGKKSSTNYDDFKSFFEFNYPNVRFDKIRRTTYYLSERTNKWEPIDNIREVIESKASDAGLSPNYVNRHLQRWVSKFEPRLCIDLPRWQGRDVVGEMVDRLTIDNIPKEYAKELFKEWGANIFRRLNDKNKREQNRMVILKGGQGIGKDSWINYMFGSFGNYFSEIEIQDRKIENYQTISDLLVANIPEFDETHRISLSTLKSLITSSGATFRAAYARKSDYVPFYVSYISSCNFDHILRDSSGNRRFMIFELDSIKWGYDDIPQDQILAQFHHLYQTRFVASKTAHGLMRDYVGDQTPIDTDFFVAEDCEAEISRLCRHKQKDWVKWQDVSEVCLKIGQRYKLSTRRVQGILKKYDLAKRDKHGVFYAKDASKVSREKLDLH